MSNESIDNPRLDMRCYLREANKLTPQSILDPSRWLVEAWAGEAPGVPPRTPRVGFVKDWARAGNSILGRGR